MPAPGAAGPADLLGDAGPARRLHRGPGRPGRGALLPAGQGDGPDRRVPAQPSDRPARRVRRRARRGCHLRLLHRTSRLLPARPPAQARPRPHRPGRTDPGTGAAGGRQGSGWRRWLRAHMAWAGWASVGAALVVVGVILGSALSSSSTPNPASNSGLPGGGPRHRRRPCAARPATPAADPTRAWSSRARAPPATAWVVRASGFEPRPAGHRHAELQQPAPGRAGAEVHPHRPRDTVRRDLPAEYQPALPRRAPARVCSTSRSPDRAAARPPPRSW